MKGMSEWKMRENQQGCKRKTKMKRRKTGKMIERMNEKEEEIKMEI